MTPIRQILITQGNLKYKKTNYNRSIFFILVILIQKYVLVSIHPIAAIHRVSMRISRAIMHRSMMAPYFLLSCLLFKFRVFILLAWPMML